jgi:cell division protein FtsW (lipid II flippase)
MGANITTEVPGMLDDPLFIIVALACLGVAVILALGISTFGKEGVESSKRANKFMRWRIIAQLGAVVLILLFVFIRRQGGQ